MSLLWIIAVTDSEQEPDKPMRLYRGEGSHDAPSYYPLASNMAGGWWTDSLESATRYSKSQPNGKVYRLDVHPSEAKPQGAPGYYFIHDPRVRDRRVEHTATYMAPWVRDPDDAGAEFRDDAHADHRPSPILRAVGIGESPCGDVRCPEFDQEHDDARSEAESTQGEIRTADVRSMNLHGMERKIDPHTVRRYMERPPSKIRPARIFTHRGQSHIIDGHHRLIADILAGRPSTFEHVDLDKEG